MFILRRSFIFTEFQAVGSHMDPFQLIFEKTEKMEIDLKKLFEEMDLIWLLSAS